MLQSLIEEVWLTYSAEQQRQLLGQVARYFISPLITITDWRMENMTLKHACYWSMRLAGITFFFVPGFDREGKRVAPLLVSQTAFSGATFPVGYCSQQGTSQGQPDFMSALGQADVSLVDTLWQLTVAGRHQLELPAASYQVSSSLTGWTLSEAKHWTFQQLRQDLQRTGYQLLTPHQWDWVMQTTTHQYSWQFADQPELTQDYEIQRRVASKTIIALPGYKSQHDRVDHRVSYRLAIPVILD